MDEETSRKTFEEKWFANPSSDTKFENFTSLEMLSDFWRPVIKVKHNSSDKFYAMKVFDKHTVVKKKMEERMVREKRLLKALSHPFILGLDFHFKDNGYLYFVEEYLPGVYADWGYLPGHSVLFTPLRKLGRFSEQVTRFYAAQVVLALEYLHSLDVIHRNLKPENLLLDSKGYLKITGFGCAKRVKGRTWTLCGTPEYLAPEIFLSKGHGKAVDWWTLGILIFEMAVGVSPFATDLSKGLPDMLIYNKVISRSGIVPFPYYFSGELRGLLRNLIQVDLSKRYGNLRNGVNDIKDHPWFASTQWMALLQREVVAPIAPDIRNPTPGDQDQDQKEEVESFVLRHDGRQPSYPLYDKCFEDF